MQSELVDEMPMKPTSSLVQKFFYSQKPGKEPAPHEEQKAREDMLLMQVEEVRPNRLIQVFPSDAAPACVYS